MNPTGAMDRRNGLIFLANFILIFLAAPVVYIGVVQAALCDKLGAGALVANLPMAAYQFGQVAPFVLAWWTPHRWEKHVVVAANLVTASLILAVFVSLALPFPPFVRIGAVLTQGLLQGLSASSSQVFMIQCLRRGTTPEGQARTLKMTFGLTPFFAVAGSLGAQYVLHPGIPGVSYPYDFALLYLLAAPCVLGVAWLSSRFDLPPVEDEPRQPLREYVVGSLRQFAAVRPFVLLWLGYLAWNATLGATTNFSLYTREAVGRDPKELSGYILALRFGCKALGGYLLGWLAVRRGLRAAVIATCLLMGAGCVWSWVVPGYGYLLAFGLLGVGELGGAYFPNYMAALSPVTEGARNVALLTMATPFSGFAPAFHGAVTERLGFAYSFAAGLLTAVIAAALVAAIRRKPKEERER
jgi:MFS family permease